MVFRRRISDNSATSTVAVQQSGKVQVALEAVKGQRRQRGQKSVTFDMGANKSYCNKIYSQKECPDLWFTAEDCQFFKEGAKTCALQIAATAKKARSTSFVTIMQDVYDVCIDSNGMAEDTMENFLTPTESKNLIRIMGQTKRLGLESFAVRSICSDKVNRRNLLVAAIQKDRRQEDPAALRKNCERISRVSGLFARILAEALEANERLEQ